MDSSGEKAPQSYAQGAPHDSNFTTNPSAFRWQRGTCLGAVSKNGGLLNKNDGNSRVTKVLYGHNAGEYHMFSAWPTFEKGAKTTAKMMTDKAVAKLFAERGANPAGDLAGPEVWRTVFGEPVKKAVILQREYDIDRAHLSNAIALLPEIQALAPKMPMMAAIPVFADDMSRLVVAYYYDSIEAFGKQVDAIGVSKEFQDIVARAHLYAKLIRARVLHLVE